VTSCPACGRTTLGRSHLGRFTYREFRYEYVVCRRCRSHFAEPMPSETLLEEIYAPTYLDEHYPEEAAGHVHNRELQLESELAVERLASLRPGGTLLDIGCGVGEVLVRAQRAGLRPEGFERSSRTARWVESRTGVRVRSGRVLQAGSFDLVHLADVLEHSPNPLELLDGARSVLALDGRLLVRGPLEAQRSLFHLAVRMQRELRGTVRALPPVEAAPLHVVLFTLEGMRSLCRRAGLEVESERVYETHWPASESATLSAKTIVKEVSLRISNSVVGRLFEMGTRNVTVLRSTT